MWPWKRGGASDDEAVDESVEDLVTSTLKSITALDQVAQFAWADNFLTRQMAAYDQEQRVREMKRQERYEYPPVRNDVVIGYRCWRVVERYERSDEASRVFGRDLYDAVHALYGHAGREWESSTMVAEPHFYCDPYSGTAWFSSIYGHEENPVTGKAPHEGRICGIHVYKTREGAEAVLGQTSQWAGHGTVGVVVGQCVIEGRCIEHTEGWRAEKATVDRLWLRATPKMANPEDFARSVAERYGVPCDVTQVVERSFTEDAWPRVNASPWGYATLTASPDDS